MNNKLLPIAAGLLLAGCAQFPEVTDITECAGANGKDVTIEYGDSKIDVTHKVKAKQDEKIVFKLEPDNQSDEGVDYKELEIMVVGKTKDSAWLNRKFKASDSTNKKFVVCIDGRRPGSYYYMVVVPGVGTIDPRVDVGLAQ
jgi:hypothetical protein